MHGLAELSPLIKYIGSKRLLVPRILETVAALDGVRSVLDVFSGTSRVGHALKRAGYRVTANDHNAYAHALGLAYVQADRRRHERAARKLLAELGALPPRAGYFTETFCVRSRYLQPKNGARVDAIREAIAAKGLDPELEAILLVSLMEAADRVDSTCGLQMAYLKSWSPRSHHDLELRVPDLAPGRGRALCRDALEVGTFGEYDLAYLDPPYNQHRYLGNYHVWETLVRGDRPEVYGTACKRVDCRAYRSPFNSRKEIASALRAVVSRVRARWLVVSFSSEGFLSRETLAEILGAEGELSVQAQDYRRYVGAQIGIYSPAGERVGRVSHLRNEEYLFVVDRGSGWARRRAPARVVRCRETRARV